MNRFLFLGGLLAMTVQSFAQTADGAATLEKARQLQDAPFARGLESFTCTVDFNWPQHLQEAPRVGDEGTEEEIRTLIAPIKTRVTVSSREAVPADNLDEAEERRLPHGGMAEGLLKHAVQFSLNQWLMAANNALLPPQGTTIRVGTPGKDPSGEVVLYFPMQGMGAEAHLTRDLRVMQIHAEGDDTDRMETIFSAGPQGYLVRSIAVGEDGRFVPGDRITARFTYQVVRGFQLPAEVVLERESHRETWRYRLSACSAVTGG